MRKLLLWAGVLTGLIGSYGCGDAQSTHNEHATHGATNGTMSAKDTDTGVFRKSEWDYDNAPEQMGLAENNYVVQFDALPQQGNLEETPWSGWYWPTYVGGITYRWNHNSEDDNERIYYDLLDWDKLGEVDLRQLSPTEKYDIYLGNRDWRLTRRERARTDIMEALNGKEIPFWEGLCDVWAEATLDYRNPGPVTLKGPSGIDVPFGAADIQALLAYHLHLTDSRVYFASRRCNVDEADLRKQLKRGDLSKAAYDEIMESAECQGINAGAFHVILANMIALRNQGFVADVTRDLQVWNQAVHGYRSKVVRERSEASAGAAPGTVREVLMKTAMIYTIEITTAWERVVTPISNRELEYKYWLELDAQDNIIGGHWVSSDRPDFLWKREPVEFSGFFAPLQTIYEESVKDLPGAEPVSPAAKRFDRLQWKVERGYVLSTIDVSGHAPAGTAKVKMKAYDPFGLLSVSHDVPMTGQGDFARQISVLHWYTGKIVLVAFDTAGKVLLETEMKQTI